ncbi:antitermination protein, partial [Pasteurella multocida]|nr:antitermination protein [Pasteurella multocida]NNI64783.1 antitermination protein [Pasteurella multocida]
YIEAKYIFNLSNYSIAKFQHTKDKSISFNAWYKRINQSIDSSEWIIAKFLDYALKNHEKADKLQKFAFNV